MPAVAESEVIAGQTTPVPMKEKGSFAGDVLKLASGATVAQALGILLSPVLSRLFAPEAFGTAAVFTSILSVIGLVVCLRYESAIMLPEKDKDASNLVVGSLFFVGVFTGLTTLGVVFLHEPVCRWLKVPDLKPFLWLLPVAVLADGGYLALRYWSTRTKRFGLLSGMRVAASASAIASMLGAGLLGYVGAGTLIGASVLGAVISAVGLGWRAWHDDRHLLLQVCWSRIIVMLKRYAKFPLVSTWSAILTQMSTQVPIVLLSFFFSQTVVGYYSYGLRVLQLPMSLIGSAISQVFLQRAAKDRALGKDLGALVEGTFERMVSLATLPLALIVLIGPEAFEIVFGAGWFEAGVYSRILAPSLLFNFAIGSLPLFSVLERQEAGLVFTGILFAGRIIPFLVGGVAQMPARFILALFSTCGALIWLLICLWQFHVLNIPQRRIIFHIGRYLIYAAPTLIITAVAKWWLELPSPWVLLSAVLASFLYCGLVLRHDSELQKNLKMIVERMILSIR
jgi:lipopolysaccharide exporter